MCEFEVKVKSIEEYVAEILRINKNLEKSTMRNEVSLYRGQSNEEYELLPAIGRGRPTTCHFSILDEERNLIELAKYKMPSIFNVSLSPINLLALLQHYGIPTRLLDVTSNPLVALYFACKGNEDKNGEVIIFKENQDNVVTYPIVNAIAETYKFSRSTSYPLWSFFNSIIEQPYFLEQKNQLIGQSENSNERWIKDCCNKLNFVHASEESIRQKVQQGQYIIFSNEIVGDDEKGYSFDKIIRPIAKNDNNLAKRILVPKELKKGFLDNLRVLGISEATLFSDNIDAICKSIVEERSSRI